MPRHVLVLGGGFAGLRAAVSLADAGARVTVLESRNSLGGRARSFTDPASGETVDNGQHLFLSGYHRTIAFLERLGTAGRVQFQPRLKVSFARQGGAFSTLDCPPVPNPWHLLLGMSRLSGFPFPDRLKLFRVLREISGSNGAHSDETAAQWLKRMGQGSQARDIFWDPLIIAALNERPEVASAAGLKRVLKTLLGEPWTSSRLGMATSGLSELYADQARQILEKAGGAVHLNRPAAGLEIEGGKIRAVRLADGSRIETDAVISTLPPSALLKLLPDGSPQSAELAGTLRRFGSSPILSVNLWLDRPVTDELFVALIGCRFQWLFNKQAILKLAGGSAGYVSLIISAAHGDLDKPNGELIALAVTELQACFPKAGVLTITRGQVVRERDATVSLTAENERYRPGPSTAFPNFFLAGDWTATGLPATIESAVLSGESAATAALR